MDAHAIGLMALAAGLAGIISPRYVFATMAFYGAAVLYTGSL